MSMQFDSVFSTFEERPFSRDRPYIPRDRILNSLGAIERDAVAAMMGVLEEQSERLLFMAREAIDRQDVKSIRRLAWAAQPGLALQVTRLYDAGWSRGQQHVKAEFRGGAIPRRLLTDNPRGIRTAADDRLRQLVREALDLEDESIVDVSEIERLVRARSLTLSGNFSNTVLDNVRTDIIRSIVPDSEGLVISRKELVASIRQRLDISRPRAVNIARTETTRAYNLGRVNSFNRATIVTHVRFLAIADDRTTDICNSRNGLIFEKGDSAIASFSPPLHFACRSVLSGVLSTVNPTHQKWVEDPQRRSANRQLAPLLRGWRTE